MLLCIVLMVSPLTISGECKCTCCLDETPAGATERCTSVDCVSACKTSDKTSDTQSCNCVLTCPASSPYRSIERNTTLTESKPSPPAEAPPDTGTVPPNTPLSLDLDTDVAAYFNASVQTRLCRFIC